MTTATTTGREVLVRLLSSVTRKEKQAFNQGNFDQLRLLLVIKGFVYELLGSISEELLDRPTLELLTKLILSNTRTQVTADLGAKGASRTNLSLKKAALSSRHMIVARRFFLGEYSSIEELLRQAWGKEVE